MARRDSLAKRASRRHYVATVNHPLEWDELDDELRNDRFHIGNAVKRMEQLDRDPLAGVLTTKPDLAKVLERLAKLL